VGGHHIEVPAVGTRLFQGDAFVKNMLFAEAQEKNHEFVRLF
jgi:hypothetical protein